MHYVSWVAVAALLMTTMAGCLSTAAPPTTSPNPADLGVPVLALANLTTIDDGKVGVSEPSILADFKGNLWVSGPTGFVTPAIQHNPQPYTHDTSMYKSADGGKTWTNMQSIPGYGRDVCPGGGDSDIAASPDGAVYLIDLYLGNVPIDVSKDGGQTWLSNCYTSIAPGVDRQWVAATNKYVWIAVNQQATGAEIYRADKMGLPTDGLVFGKPQSIAGNGPLVVDQKDGTLYVAGSGANILVSTDGGTTFTTHQTGLKGHALGGSFISIALDAQGHVFVAGSGKEGLVISGSADKGATWTPGTVYAPYGTAGGDEYAFAWMAAGGDGTVDMAWYGQPAHDSGTAYYVYAIQQKDFLHTAPKGPAANGTYAFTQVTATPIATKPLCQGINLVGLTPCDANGDKTRALGDFFESAVDAQGRFIIAFNDANGHEPPQLKFAQQTLGPLALPQLP